VIASPLETRAANAVWDRASDSFTLYTTSHYRRVYEQTFSIQG
jgi:hypothetical protein